MNVTYKYLFPALALIVIIIVALLIVFSLNRPNDATNNNTETSNDLDTDEDNDEVETFTLAQVEAANSTQNCLVIYQDEVYKIPTSFFSQHEGGSDAIANECGGDITEAFSNQHSATTAAINQLRQFYAGELESEDSVEDEQRAFTSAEVTSANIIENCLIIYKNSVYRIPENYPQTHPGGANSIINACGTDVTSSFDSPHSGTSALSILEDFFAGTLSD